jgi:ubiquinone/menaquinone biosynthesis C-methylase UbiE
MDLRDSPERFDPETMGGSIATQHFARYRLAAMVAEGKDVLDAGCGVGYGTALLARSGAKRAVGVDASAEAVDLARTRSDTGAEFRVADIRKLPFDEASFDLVTCFEAIEHVEQPGAALTEFARVLNPEGLLLISSPNRIVYPPGNPHHVHEFEPEELREALSKRFSQVVLLRQHDWLCSLVGSDNLARQADPIQTSSVQLGKLTALEPGREAFTVALASNGPLPPLPPVVIGNVFDEAGWYAIIEHERQARLNAEYWLQNIQGSTSWRVTAPLRWIGSVARSVMRALRRP